MESPQPPIKQEIVKTLPLKRQKSNFEQQLDSFKEELSVLQAQLDFFKTGLSECQNQTNKDHKHIKKLNKGFGGFIEDQGRTNREIKTNMVSLDAEHISINQSLKKLTESTTNLEEKVKVFEQKNNTEQPQPSNIPKIVITQPTNEQKTVNKALTLPKQRTPIRQSISNDFRTHKNEINTNFEQVTKITTQLKNLVNEQEEAISSLDTEQIKLNELIKMLAENSTETQDKIKNDVKKHQ